MIITTDQDTLRAFMKRRHPDYWTWVSRWQFFESTYNGGRDWFYGNIHKGEKEGDLEYAKRIDRAYRFNHTREVVDLVQKYIAKAMVARNEKDAPKEIQSFWQNVTLSGLDIDQYMNLVGGLSSIFGRIWVFTDTNKSAEVLSVADAKKAGTRVYSYLVTPENMLDMGWDEVGQLNWVKVRETARDDADPISSSGEMIERIRLWTRNEWALFEEIDGGKRGPIIRKVDEGANKLGEVPCFAVDHVIGENRYIARGLINDIAYLDRACANYLSYLDQIMQDQTFSQLTIPAQAMLPGEEAHTKLLEMSTKRAFVYDGEGSGKGPAYISPDPKQAGVILAVVNKIIGEIYHGVGMSGERTKEDNAVGIDNSSGVAKAYDFERVNSLLASKASSLENGENRLIDMVLKWHSQKSPEEELVSYPETFDVRSLFDEFTVAEKLLLVEAPAEVRRQQMMQVIDKLFPRLATEIRDKMEAELASWPVDPVERAADLAKATAPPTKFPAPSGAKPAAAKRQGQVTKDTGK